MTTLIYACGTFSAAFALFHLAFWRLFRWKTELAKLSAANKAIMQILNLRLIYVFAFTAALCFAFPAELLHTRLGNAWLAGNSLFWLGRALEQFIFLRIHHPAVHALTAAFLSGCILFALPLFL